MASFVGDEESICLPLKSPLFCRDFSPVEMGKLDGLMWRRVASTAHEIHPRRGPIRSLKGDTRQRIVRTRLAWRTVDVTLMAPSPCSIYSCPNCPNHASAMLRARMWKSETAYPLASTGDRIDRSGRRARGPSRKAAPLCWQRLMVGRLRWHCCAEPPAFRLTLARRPALGYRRDKPGIESRAAGRSGQSIARRKGGAPQPPARPAFALLDCGGRLAGAMGENTLYYGDQHPSLQIMTIEDRLAGKTIDMPLQQDIRSFKQTPKAKRRKKEEAKLF